MSSVPKGWRRKTLSEVASWGSGGTPAAGNKQFYGGDIPWAVIGDLSDGLVTKTAKSITQLGLDCSSAKRVPEGAVLVAMYGSIGKLGIAGIPLTTNQAIAFAIPGHELDPKFLFYYLMSQRRQLDAMGKGATQRNISQTILKSWPIVLPDAIREQRMIVELIEDHLSRLDAASVELRHQQKRIEGLRISGINRATSTPEAKYVSLVDLLTHSVGGLWGRESGADEMDVRVIRVTELKRHGELEISTAATRSLTRNQYEGRALHPGDLLLEKSGGGPKTPVGRVALVRHVDEPSVCANFMHLMRPNPDRVLPRFLHLVLNAFHQSGGTAPMQTASTNIRNIKASEYLQIQLQLPSLEEQQSALAEVEPLLEACTQLENSLELARRRTMSLRQAVLTAAFEGRLTGGSMQPELLLESANV